MSYVKSGEKYTYTVACPTYLSFTGNFALTNNDDLSLIIWPSLFMCDSGEYGIGIFDQEKNFTYRFYVDNNLQYLNVKENNYSDDEERYLHELLDEHRKELNEMHQLAKIEWFK